MRKSREAGLGSWGGVNASDWHCTNRRKVDGGRTSRVMQQTQRANVMNLDKSRFVVLMLILVAEVAARAKIFLKMGAKPKVDLSFAVDETGDVTGEILERERESYGEFV